MSGKYLATDLEQLKDIGNGKALQFIKEFLDRVNEFREDKAELVAYEIKNNHDIIKDINCLFKSTNGFSYRSFDFYVERERIEDTIKSSAEYGIGITEYEMEFFFSLRSFYLEKTNESLPI